MPTSTPATQTNWTPTVWSKEALRAREAVLLMASRVLRKDKEVSSFGRVINILETANLTTNAVGADGDYTTQALADTMKTITVDQYREASFSIRDDLEMQSILDGMKEYSKKVGYALGEYIEQTLMALEADASITQVQDIAGDITEPDIRSAVVDLDTAKAPSQDRYIAFSPNQKSVVLAIARFSEAHILNIPKSQVPQLTNELIDLYGMEALWSPNIRRRTIVATDRTVNMVWQKEAFAAAVQQDVKMEKFRTKLANDWVGSILFGVAVTRPDHASMLRTTGI